MQFRLLHVPIVVINHTNYDKEVFAFRLLRPILGLGLVTNIGGEGWLRQRRLMQLAFHRAVSPLWGG